MFHVKQDITLERLFGFLQSHGMELSDQQKDRVVRYYELLRLWSGRQNLLSKNDAAFIVERHLLVSFYYAFRLLSDGFAGKSMVDLGSGAGFPGVLLSIYFEENPCALLDSSRKKILFLRRVVEELGLNSPVLLGRAEELNLSENEKFSVVVVRAVASLQKLARLSSFLIKKSGVLYSPKGENYQTELKNRKTPEWFTLKEMPIEPDWREFSGCFKGKTMIRMEF